MSSIPIASTSNYARQASFHPLSDSASLHSTGLVTHRPYRAPASYELRPPDLCKVVEKFDPSLGIISNHSLRYAPTTKAVGELKDGTIDRFSDFVELLRSLRASGQQGKERLESIAFGRSNESSSMVVKDVRSGLSDASVKFRVVTRSLQDHARDLEIAANTPPTRRASLGYWLIKYNVPLWSAIVSPVISMGSAILDLTNVVRVMNTVREIHASEALVVGSIVLFGILKQKCVDYDAYQAIEKTQECVAAMTDALDELDQEAFKELNQYWSNFSRYLMLTHERARANPPPEKLLALSKDMDMHVQNLDYLITKLVDKLPVRTPKRSVKAKPHPRMLPKAHGQAELPSFFKAF